MTEDKRFGRTNVIAALPDELRIRLIERRAYKQGGEEILDRLLDTFFGPFKDGERDQKLARMTKDHYGYSIAVSILNNVIRDFKRENSHALYELELMEKAFLESDGNPSNE